MSINFLKVDLIHKSSEIQKNKEFHFNYKDVKISFFKNSPTFTITLESKATEAILESIFFEIYDYLFLLLGSFPIIKILEINGKLSETSNFSRKYNTAKYFDRINLTFVPISKETINEKVLLEFRQINSDVISSLQFIVSEAYVDVVIFHKLMMILHVVDGLVDRRLERKILEESNETKKEWSNYREKAGQVFKNFTYYDEKYNLDILSTMGLSNEEFLGSLADTRNSHSHFLKFKKLTIKSSIDQLIYFEFLYYSIRLFICDYYFGLEEFYIEKNICNYYYSVYDWISEIKNNNTPRKSVIYKFSDAMMSQKDKNE